MTRWRLHVILALLCAGVAAATLVDSGTGVYVVPPLLALSVLVAARQAWAGPVLVAVATLVGGYQGVSTENPGPLLAVVVTAYLAGRRAARVPGLLGVATLALASWVTDDLALATLLFITVVVGGIWGFGRLVRHRAEEAERAGAEAARVAADDPVVVAARVVRAERERLAADTISLIRVAVADMRDSARHAAAGLDPIRLTAVQARGTEAVADLRRLLGLLRAEPAEESTASTHRVGRWPTPAEWGPTLAAFLLLPIDASYAVGVSPTSWVLLAAVCMAPLLQRHWSAVAALLVGGLPVLALAIGAEFFAGFSMLVTITAVAWFAGSTGHRLLWLAVVMWLAVRIWVVAETDPTNIPIELAIVGLPLFAGSVWHERDREFRRARVETERLLGVQEAAVAQAVAEERLRIARELHDVSSHAVGVMVLQAGAALAQRVSDPARARAALGTIDSAAAQASAELDTLARVLTSDGEIQPWVGAEDGLAGALERLADRMRGAGLEIDVRLGPLPSDHRIAGTVYRTVQEALTNAARHAPGSRVSVAVARSDGAVVIEVIDAGGHREAALQGSGFGLEGLAERVRALGGEVAAGPRPEGGFAVRARVPNAYPTVSA